MAIGLVYRTDIVEVNAVVLLNPLQCSGHESGKIVVTVFAQIDGSPTSGIGGQSIFREVDWWRIEKCQEVGDTSLLGHAHEFALASLLVPVVGTFFGEETLCACSWLNLRIVSLFLTAGSKVETPYRQSDAQGLTLGIGGSGEQPIGNFLLLGLVLPQTDELH